MSPEQKAIIRETWDTVLPIADTAAGLFYDRLFELDPELRELFCNTDMERQKTNLIKALTATASNLDSLDSLSPLLQDLGRRHASYGVSTADYQTVGAALLWTLEQGLGEAWTPQVKTAWTAAYTFVAETMQQGAATPNGAASRHAA